MSITQIGLLFLGMLLLLSGMQGVLTWIRWTFLRIPRVHQHHGAGRAPIPAARAPMASTRTTI